MQTDTICIILCSLPSDFPPKISPAAVNQIQPLSLIHIFIISTIGIAGAAETAKLLSFIKSGDISAALETVDRFYKNGKDMAAVIDELTSLFRDMLIYKMSPASPGSLFSGMFSREAITELSKGVSPEKIMWWLSAAKAAVQDLKTFSTSRLAVEMCILKLTNCLLYTSRCV